MNLLKRLSLILLLGMAMLCLGIGCSSNNNETPAHVAQGHLTLQTHSLDFALTVNEQQVNITNTGDDSLTWTITPATIPYWAKAAPISGSLAADAQTSLTVRVFRSVVGPGTTTADLYIDTDANDDTLTLSIQRTCDLLGDDFNSGNATGWTATSVDKSQGSGYVVLTPNDALQAARLTQLVTPIYPFVISARLERINQTAVYKQYGVYLEGSSPTDALYFTVYVDNDTNYTLEQRVGGGDWQTLSAGYTALLSTSSNDWNILRLELYKTGQQTFARAYADTASVPLFDGIQIDQSLSFARMGLRTEEYTIHADWFCAARQ